MLSIIYKDEMMLLRHKKLYTIYYLLMNRLINIYKVYLYICLHVCKKRGVDTENDMGIIVSLTTFKDRIKTTKFCIETIMHQTVKPSRIVLWLAGEEFLNREEIEKEYANLISRGLEIRYCENLRSHKKYYYTMKENVDATVITLDDDVYYPVDTIERLINASEQNPGTIICNIGKIIKKDEKIFPYNTWPSIYVRTSEKEKKICPIGVGGVLYPPHSLDERVFDKNDILRLCYHTDDLWLNAMARLNKTNIICLGSFPVLFCIGNSQINSLSSINCGLSRNDVELNNIKKKYPDAF